MGPSTNTFAFFYAVYLTYKRKYKPFKYLLYIFWASILLDVCSGLFSLKAAFSVTHNPHKVKTEIPYNATNHKGLTEEEYNQMNEAIESGVYAVMPFVMAFFTLFPLINKIYLIIKMKAYADYIAYKKEEARPVPVVELPHKLPECSQ
ncbi:hypothetical protein BCR42DRAFT_31382 [Absidia repens]|uniref:Uncharacterized protein n=1 Tax=Absidia repens TaxID=90262 RepID=A0A1X2IJC8_9FUNG|nr:hypothetical protein BCR42DRAFT_31382 [Absidia repens]